MIALRRALAGFAATILLSGCASPLHPAGDREEIAPHSASHTRVIDGRELHWVSAGNPDGPTVLFIHGTPGSWKGFADYLNHPALTERFHLISVDRPGFGRSGGGEMDLSLVAQARKLRQVLAPSAAPAIIVGHSLGGPIAVRMAADCPEAVAGLVLVAASLDPALEHPRWYNRLADWPLVRWMLPEVWVRANEEIMVLHDALQALTPRWGDVRAPVVVIHGDGDGLAYPGNADFVESRLPAEQIDVRRVADSGHFVLWEQPEWVVTAILDLVGS